MTKAKKKKKSLLEFCLICFLQKYPTNYTMLCLEEKKKKKVYYQLGKDFHFALIFWRGRKGTQRMDFEDKNIVAN